MTVFKRKIKNIKKLIFVAQYQKCSKSTWSYENRASKHFVIFLNFLSNILFTMLFVYVVFWLFLWLGICEEVDVDRITILQPFLVSSRNALPHLMGRSVA